MAIQNFTDLEVYNLSEKMAMDVFRTTVNFPNEGKYSLTDQVRRSSRSVAVNIAEDWGKRHYEQVFKRHLVDSMGSLYETKSWIKFAHECKYIENDIFERFMKELDELGAKLYNLHRKWE